MHGHGGHMHMSKVKKVKTYTHMFEQNFQIFVFPLNFGKSITYKKVEKGH